MQELKQGPERSSLSLCLSHPSQDLLARLTPPTVGWAPHQSFIKKIPPPACLQASLKETFRPLWLVVFPDDLVCVRLPKESPAQLVKRGSTTALSFLNSFRL